MIQKMYAIRDSKAETYFNPFYSGTQGEAERQFAAVTNDPKSTICQFPDDFDLFHIGEYDTNTGKLNALDTPSHIIKANALKKV